MIVTSLKGMPEVRLGNIFAPPVEITFEPWVKAWADGLHRAELRRACSRGFWNSVQITVPSVIVSIAIALGQRLRARQLAVQGRPSSSSPS